ncbi:MAG: LPS export ABC transporter periplasmic protein LptC, partial [bacterium]|nr:LPS export ABC transporter periplasmic protein LptC [bacterium]
MKHKKAIKIAIIVSLVLVLIYIFTGMKSKDETDFMSELKVDGEGMIHVTFNKKNQKAMELKCSESNREGRDKITMMDIEGLIFKKGRMSKDIKISGKSGYVSNNSHNFFIEKKAKITSEDFVLRSKNFFLKDQALMSTEKKVHYELSDLKGVAKAGMEYYLKKNVLKLFKTRGHYKRDSRDFEFKTDTLWTLDQKNLIVMEKDTVIREGESILRSDWVSIKFTDKYKHILQTTSQKSSYLYIDDKENNKSKEIKAVNIVSLYSNKGKLTKVTLTKNGEIMLRDEESETLISSDLIELNFIENSEQLKNIHIPIPGQIENTGSTEYTIGSNEIDATFNKDGLLDVCSGEGNTRFIIDDYIGFSNAIKYKIEKNLILLAGIKDEVIKPDEDESQKGEDKKDKNKSKEDSGDKIDETEGDDKQDELVNIKKGAPAKIIHHNNTFTSIALRVNTKDKIITTKSGVKSIITLAKKNVLFANSPIFINSKLFSISDKENRLFYGRGVSLIQGDISLTGKSLEIIDENKIMASGSVNLTFKSDDNEIIVKGQTLTFNAMAMNIEISGKAAIKNDESVLSAAQFILQFNNLNEVTKIEGTDDIRFSKDELVGTSGKVLWFFKENTIILKKLPKIVKKNGGTTIGDELKIDL